MTDLQATGGTSSMKFVPTTDFDHLLPEGLHLKPYQHVGVFYALLAKRTLIGDEMGLGKTWQAIVAFLQWRLAAQGQLVVVCPASLKGNWARELHLVAPQLTVEVAAGRKGQPSDADVLVVNYDILSGWLPVLHPACLVLDEVHYAKNRKAQRTDACRKLAEQVPADGLVLGLTGTAVLNRPNELVEPLRLLGKLDDVAPVWAGKDAPGDIRFLFSFCDPKHNGHGWDFKGASDTERLNANLRANCYVRRLRKDVLGMNDTVRVPVLLSGPASTEAYKAAVNETYENALAELTGLRVAAGLAKVETAIEWIDNFLDSNPDDSLVVFAHHVAVQQALAGHYGCPTILGGQKDVEAQKAAFQAGEHRVIVCSLKAAREGHTLTAASTVLFVEMGWGPGEQQQAEDRVNRIGQEADQVMAYYLVGEDTIDEWVYDLIEEKRVVLKAVLDGTATAAQAEAAGISIQAALLERLAAQKRASAA